LAERGGARAGGGAGAGAGGRGRGRGSSAGGARRVWSARERNTALALGRLRPGAWDGALRLAEAHGSERLPPWLAVECLAAAAAHLARQPTPVRRMAARRDLRLRGLVSTVRRSVDDLDLDGLLGALFAFASLQESAGGGEKAPLSAASVTGDDPMDLARILEERILEELELSGRGGRAGGLGSAGRKLGPALLSFARMGHRPSDALVASIEAELPRVLFSFSPGGVCQALWGFARIGRDPGGSLVSRLALEGRDRLGGMSAGMIARALFSFGRLGFYPGRQVAAAYVEEFGAKIANASAQDVAHALWGCARVSHGLSRAGPGTAPGFLEICASRLEELAGGKGTGGRSGASRVGGDLNPKLVSSSLWAFSRYDFHPGDECMAVLLGFLEENFAEFDLVGQGLVWYALARLQHQPGQRAVAAAEEALRVRAAEVRAVIGSTEGGEVAVEGADEPAGWLDEGVTLVTEHAEARGSRASDTDLASAFRSATFVLFGCAKLALEPPPGLLGAACDALEEWAPAAEPWDLSVALWSLAVLQAPSPQARTLVERLWAAMAESGEDLQLGAQGAMMLFHAYVAFSLEQPDVDLELNEALVEAGRVEWRRAHLLDDAQGSYLQQDVASALARMGLPHRFEQLISGELFRTDIFLPDSNLALEVDGPTHFLANHPGEPNGATRLRDRLLRQRGHEVVSVPHFEWECLEGPGPKEAYLKNKLVAAGVELPETPSALELSGGFAERVAEAGREADNQARASVRGAARPVSRGQSPQFPGDEDGVDDAKSGSAPTPGEIRAALRAAREAEAAAASAGADVVASENPAPPTLGLEDLAEALWEEDPGADGAGLLGDETFDDLFSEEDFEEDGGAEDI